MKTALVDLMKGYVFKGTRGKSKFMKRGCFHYDAEKRVETELGIRVKDVPQIYVDNMQIIYATTDPFYAMQAAKEMPSNPSFLIGKLNKLYELGNEWQLNPENICLWGILNEIHKRYEKDLAINDKPGLILMKFEKDRINVVGEKEVAKGLHSLDLEIDGSCYNLMPIETTMKLDEVQETILRPAFTKTMRNAGIKKQEVTKTIDKMFRRNLGYFTFNFSD